MANKVTFGAKFEKKVTFLIILSKLLKNTYFRKIFHIAVVFVKFVKTYHFGEML